MDSSQAIAWAAGIFEGEGCITYSRIKERKESFRFQLTMSSSDKDVLDRFALSVNCGKVLGPYKGQKEGNKDRYNWHIQNQRDCLYVLGQIYPFLCERRRQKAEEMLDALLERWI